MAEELEVSREQISVLLICPECYQTGVALWEEAALQPDHQYVLRLTGSYAEMEQQLQVPPGTLRSRLYRARAALVALRQKQSSPEGLP